MGRVLNHRCTKTASRQKTQAPKFQDYSAGLQDSEHRRFNHPGGRILESATMLSIRRENVAKPHDPSVWGRVGHFFDRYQARPGCSTSISGSLHRRK